WLEGNGLTRLEGLENQSMMRTLYVHENLIEKIEGLDSMLKASCKNFIKCVENLSHLGTLTTLLLSYNCLRSADDLRHVLQCPSLQTLDLQHNRIDDPQVVEVVAAMPDLRVLYLQGNPVIKKIQHYRKVTVSRCLQLKYLDDRPVFDNERRRCMAWATGLVEGGISRAQEAEREEMGRIRDEKREAQDRQHFAFEKVRKHKQK
ncbi:unnamed protein product, partial [Discosporangium mesarthrocarpum]